MKLRKLFLFVLMTFVLISFLSGCIIIPRHQYYNIPADEVKSVQFYDLRNLGFSHSPGFDQTLSPVCTIPEADKEVFLDDFSKLRFSDAIVITIAAIDPSFYYGDWVVRINFTNGQYTLYSCGGYGETFDAEGKRLSSTHLSCEDAELENLIKKYYKTK